MGSSSERPEEPVDYEGLEARLRAAGTGIVGFRRIEEKPSPKKREDEEHMFFPVPNYTKIDVDKAGRVNVTINDMEITILSHKGKLHAIPQKCPHRGGPLMEGEIEDIAGPGPCITCPWHHWKFDLKDGKCIEPCRPDVRATIFPVKVSCPDHKISVGFTQFAPTSFTDTESF